MPRHSSTARPAGASAGERNWLSAFRAWLRDLVAPRRPRLQARDEVFTPIDIEWVKRELKLLHHAQRMGAKNLPATGDSEFDGPHRLIEQYIAGEITAAFQRANTEFQHLKAASRARDIRPLLLRIERLAEETEKRIAAETRAATIALAKLSRERAEVQQRLDSYRERYGLNRAPQLRDQASRRFLLASTLLLGAFQALANMILFAQGFWLGLAAGSLLALLLGVFDVALHYTCGRVGCRVEAPDWRSRITGGAMVLVMTVTVLLWNLGMVHLRNGIRRHGFDQGVELWSTSLIENPFGFSDAGSYALLLIGLACSISAVVTGWIWNEPVPLLREAGQKLQELDEDLEFHQQEKDHAHDEGWEWYAEERRDLLGQARHNLEAIEGSLARMRRLRENLFAYLKDAERAFRVLVQFYRDENRIARSDEPPRYFQIEPQLDMRRPLALDLDEAETYVAEQRAAWERWVAAEQNQNTADVRPNEHPAP